MALCSYLKEPVFDAGARDDMGKLDVEENIAKWRKYGRVSHYRHPLSGEYLTLAAETTIKCIKQSRSTAASRP